MRSRRIRRRTVAFSHSGAQDEYKRNWGTTLKSVFDGLVYALFTAGAFGWLWPR